MSDVPHLLNVKEAAQHLGVSASYLDHLRVRGGGPPFIRLGVRVRYDPDDLAEWLKAQKRRSTSEAQRAAVGA